MAAEPPAAALEALISVAEMMMAGTDPQFDVSPFALDRFADARAKGEANVV